MDNKLVDGNAIQQLIAGDESAFTAVYELYSENVCYGQSTQQGMG